MTENSKDLVDLKKVKSNLSMAVKPTAKKPKINRRRRTSNRQTVKTKNSVRCDNNQPVKEENSNLMDMPKVVFVCQVVLLINFLYKFNLNFSIFHA